METLKQRVFATAFSAADCQQALGRYYEVFEKDKEREELDLEEWSPDDEADVYEMLKAAKRAGAIE